MTIPSQNNPVDGEKPTESCDHEWEFVDDSYDHAFGTERIHYMRCEKCDATKECERDSGPIAGEEDDPWSPGWKERSTPQ